MPRNRSVYTYLDKTLQIQLKDVLKTLDSMQNKALKWSWGDRASIELIVIPNGDNFAMGLMYRANGKQEHYFVDIISKPSNLGKGHVWYFICPVSGLQCRILYLVHGQFVHRKAYPGQHYYHQTNSHNHRLIDSLSLRNDAAVEKCKPHTIRFSYDGKPTKRWIRHGKVIMKYSRIWDQINKNVLKKLDYDLLDI